MSEPGLTEHLLTEAERSAFERDGYIMLSGALPTETVAALIERAEHEYDRFRTEDGVGPHHVLNLHDLIGRDPAWLELCDEPTTFPKVWGVLGWHIQLFHTQLIVTPPAPAGAVPGAYGWHQDNNRMNEDLETVPQPRISVKVGYFLTDISEIGMGNLCVVPGSQRFGGPRGLTPGAPNDEVQITARAGDAIVFDRRLWHAASTNVSEQLRIFLTYGYAYRWLRPKSAMDHADLYDRVSPIRRQLLGWGSSANGYFDPTDDDVPLRALVVRSEARRSRVPATGLTTD